MRLISDDDIATITIWQEARGEPFEGMVAVGEVILNRMRKRYSSDGTVAGTVIRAWQWSGWNTADPSRVRSFQLDSDDAKVKECARAWAQAKLAQDITKGAVLYLNPTAVAKIPIWVTKSVKVAEIGRHVFYIPK